MANPTNNESNHQPRPFPSELAPGLDLFAATWLQHWTEAGGSVHLQDDDRTTLGFPMYNFSPAYVEPPADLPEQVRSSQRSFAANHYHGQMRALLSLIEALPYGSDALNAHMRAHGMRYYYRKQGAGS
ncbi:hypothetical protein [Altericroceibacterium xinjiangense]|uniref:hypothetical protein n=1 Tax=Altericroceibacterium xinjiangense TaxID=762261 RepID=UPI000F7DE277|nr:hypothetical protein [Altericroceibacterium xinjiangense]